MRLRNLLPACALLLAPSLTLSLARADGGKPASSSTSSSTPATAGQVLVSGAVADEATRSALITRLRALYGVDAVVDRLTVGQVLAPPGWYEGVQQLLNPALKAVHKGEINIEGSQVRVWGEVATEAARRQAGSDIAASLPPGYAVRTELRVAAAAQQLLDATLGLRIIEFESGLVALRPSGMAILDEMAAALQKLKGAKVEVIGHTDNVGQRAANLALSQARAQAVRTYLAGKGIAADAVAVSGQGPDRPVADNASAEGRARNRRIEFRVVDSL